VDHSWNSEARRWREGDTLVAQLTPNSPLPCRLNSVQFGSA
jgi:hypothetical protein